MAFDDELSKQETVTLTKVANGFTVDVGYHGVREQIGKVFATEQAARAAGEAALKRFKTAFDRQT